ncbi:hypothetical protein [Parerythrobacter lacustris]|uniref:Uncharacterized protein n=1 Tax=Parerythrobacter lacustris TaxID=2969984 RepID=A0ABT1XQG8_9SPHN|nr:hypothetical protein [Parerythrobacter lacustris]MCR2832890.1 hypothetical protein [Parerythrobacter lacustris]
MSNWEMGSAAGAGGARDVTINFLNDDSIGKVGGTLWFKGEPFTVSGQWAAIGTTPGRKGSSVAFWGVDSTGSDYIAGVGSVDIENSGPARIDLNLLRIQDGTSQQYGWDGVLKPLN